MIKLDSYLEKPFARFILWFLTGLLIIFYGILIVNADEISIYGAQFTWCNEYTEYCSVNSGVLYGENAKITLQGPMNAVDYNQGKYEYLAGIRFYSEITGQTNDVVSLYYTLTLTGLQESEIYAQTNFNSRSFYYTSSNVTLINAKLLSSNYVEDINPTNIDGNPVYLGTQTIKFKVNVQLNGNFNESSLYVGIGSFSNANSQSSIIFHQHIANVVTVFAENYYTIDNNSTIINQNDIMINQNQTIIDQNNQTNNELGELNDNITNEEYDTPDFSGLEMADDTPISDLVLMPINYMNKMINAFSNQCMTYNIDFGILGTDYVLHFPCIRVEDWVGSSAWHIIDMLVCFFMIYEIGMLAVTIFNDFTSLRDTYDSLYTPRHAKPLGKHTSEVE